MNRFPSYASGVLLVSMIMKAQIKPLRFLAVLIASTFMLPAVAKEPNGIFFGVSAARVSTEYGRAATDLQRTDGNYSLHRADAGSYGDMTVGLEISMPINPWLSIDFFTSGKAADSGPEQWIPDPPFPPAAPGDLPVPDVASFVVRSESRIYLISGTVQREIFASTIGYVRVGASVMQSDLTLFDNQQNVFARFDSTDTRPWLALGARYRFDSGFTLNAEIGAATEGNQMARIGAGWTF